MDSNVRVTVFAAPAAPAIVRNATKSTTPAIPKRFIGSPILSFRREHPLALDRSLAADELPPKRAGRHR
jgi:hypothetical protein